mgnify:CR=1 FL=1
MNNDRLLKRKEIFFYLQIKDTKLKELIKAGKFIKPIFAEGFCEALYSLNELEEWITSIKKKRDQND